MAAATETAEAAPATEAPAKKSGAMPLVAIALGAALLGGGAGVFVLGPRLTAKQAAAPVRKAESKAEKKPGKIFKLDNLIVNPAGSQGSRFLMISVAYEIASDNGDAVLKEHEVQLRDGVVTLLGQLSLDALTRPTTRDELKQRLATVVQPFLPAGTPVQVYIPQFVIQ